MKSNEHLEETLSNKDHYSIHSLLKAVKAHNITLLDAGPTGTLLYEMDTYRTTYVSPTLCDMLEIVQDKLYKPKMSGPLRCLLPVEDLPFFEMVTRESLQIIQETHTKEAEQLLFIGEFRARTRWAKKEKWFKYRAIVLPGKAVNAHLLVYITDITIMKSDECLSWFLYDRHRKKMLQFKTKKIKKKLLACLTVREKEIATLIAEGLTNAEISDQLFVSKNTIKTHRQHIYEKLNVRKSSELIKVCIQNGLISLDH